MFKKMLIGAGAVLSLVVPLILALPTIVHSLGVHPVYEDARDYSLPGKRALLITTSHGVLNAPAKAEVSTSSPRASASGKSGHTKNPACISRKGCQNGGAGVIG